MSGSKPCPINCACRKHLSFSNERRRKIGVAIRPLAGSNYDRVYGTKRAIEIRAKQSVALKAHKRTPEHSKNLSVARQKHMDSHTVDCRCVGNRNPSMLGFDLADCLVAVGFKVLVLEQRFGRYTVDIYLPELHLAFEADGDYWHRLKNVAKRDKVRDRYLMKRFNLPVVRIWESEIKELREVIL